MSLQLNPYLVFDGTCEEAFLFYARCLGGTLAPMSRFADAPGCEDFPAEYRQRIMHARLEIGGPQGTQVLMGSDNHPAHPYEGVKGCSIAVAVDGAEDAERIFAALSEGGTVAMPIQETFWAQRFGMCTDRFGVPWMVNGAMRQ